MKSLIWAVILIAPAMLAAQGNEKDVLTVDHCRSAERVYKDEVDKPNGLRSIPFTILDYKEKETANCLVLDHSDPDYVQGYILVMGKYVTEMNSRAFHYVERHNLMKDMIDEDAKGIR